MLYTVLLFIIILLTIAIYAQNIKKSEHFSQKKCYGKVSSKMNNGRHGYYSNFMLDTYSNFDTAFQFLKNKSIKALNALNQYKVDLEQAYDIDRISRDNLIKTSDSVTNTHNTLRNMVNNKIISYDNELSSTRDKLENIKKDADQQSQIQKEEVIERVNSIVNQVAKNKFKEFEQKTVQSNEFKKPFGDIIANKVSDKADVKSYNWQCEPNIIGAPIRVNSENGAIQCLSVNGSNCDINFCKNNDVRDIDFANVKTVSCTDRETATAGHWCNKAASVLLNEDTTDYRNCPKDWSVVNREYQICMAPDKYLGTSVHNSNAGNVVPACKLPNKNCQVFTGMTNNQKMIWSKATNTLFPPKVNIIQRARDLTNVLGQVDNVLRSTMGTGSPPSRIDNYTVYKNGVIVKAYNLKEKTGEDKWAKGKVIYDNIISSNINFRVGSGTFLSIRPQYSDPNVNFDTNRIFVVLSGFIKIPKGITSIKLRTISNDGIRVLTRKPGQKNWNLIINNWRIQEDTLSDSNPVSVEPDTFLEYQIEFFEVAGSATCVFLWSLKNDNLFDVVPREALFIDPDQCSKTVKLQQGNNWEIYRDSSGNFTPIRLNDLGNVECISVNNKDCLWTNTIDAAKSNIEKYSDSDKLDPHVCTQENYNKPEHWCAKARTQLDPSNKQVFTEETYGGRCGRIDNKDVKCLPGRCCNKYGYCGNGKFCEGDRSNRAFNG
jgi:hypothetical protein